MENNFEAWFKEFNGYMREFGMPELDIRSAVAGWNANIQKWIKMEDHDLKDGNLVIVYSSCKWEQFPIQTARYQADEHKNFKAGYYFIGIGGVHDNEVVHDVTHYMPLPDKPEAEND